MKFRFLLALSVATVGGAVAGELGCIDDGQGRWRAELTSDNIPPYRQGVVTTVDPDAVPPWMPPEGNSSPIAIPK